MKRNASYKVALGGIISSLCVFLMFLTGILPLFTYVLPALAGMFLMIIVVEIDKKWAFVTFAGVSILSLLIAPDKEAAVLFTLFLGHYPIIKSYIEKIKFRWLEWIVKVLTFNACILISYLIIINVFGMKDVLDGFGQFGRIGIIAVLILANITFVLYDILLTLALTDYMQKYRPKFLRKFTKR